MNSAILSLKTIIKESDFLQKTVIMQESDFLQKTVICNEMLEKKSFVVAC